MRSAEKAVKQLKRWKLGKKCWIGNRKQEKQTKKIKLLLWKTLTFLEKSIYRRGEGQVSSHSPKFPLNKLML